MISSKCHARGGFDSLSAFTHCCRGKHNHGSLQARAHTAITITGIPGYHSVLSESAAANDALKVVPFVLSACIIACSLASFSSSANSASRHAHQSMAASVAEYVNPAPGNSQNNDIVTYKICKIPTYGSNKHTMTAAAFNRKRKW